MMPPGKALSVAVGKRWLPSARKLHAQLRPFPRVFLSQPEAQKEVIFLLLPATWT